MITATGEGTRRNRRTTCGHNMAKRSTRKTGRGRAARTKIKHEGRLIATEKEAPWEQLHPKKGEPRSEDSRQEKLTGNNLRGRKERNRSIEQRNGENHGDSKRAARKDGRTGTTILQGHAQDESVSGRPHEDSEHARSTNRGDSQQNKGRNYETDTTIHILATRSPEQARRSLQSDDDKDGEGCAKPAIKEKVDRPQRGQHAKRNQPDVKRISTQRSGIMKRTLTITRHITGTQSCASTKEKRTGTGLGKADEQCKETVSRFEPPESRSAQSNFQKQNN